MSVNCIRSLNENSSGGLSKYNWLFLLKMYAYIKVTVNKKIMLNKFALVFMTRSNLNFIIF